jgi:hypothetical protein
MFPSNFEILSLHFPKRFSLMLFAGDEFFARVLVERDQTNFKLLAKRLKVTVYEPFFL